VLGEERKIELARLQEQIDTYALGTQARVDAQIAYNQKKQELDQQEVALDDQLTANKKKKIQERLDAEKQNEQARIEIAQNVFASLIALNDSFAGSSEKDRKRAFNRNKALGIAQATIQTYQSATAAYASQLTIPSPDAPIRAGIAAGAAIAAGLAQIAVISRTQYKGESPSASAGGGGGSMGGGSMGGSTSAPALDLSFLNNGQTKAQPIQSYVLATNVTSAQDAQQKILDQSKLIK
jgi:hypothetical protein